MKFPVYPSYGKPPTAWLGALPHHWRFMALRQATLSMCDGPFGSSLKSSHYSETGIRVIRLQNIGSGLFRDEDAAFVDPAYFASLGGHDARPGDLLVAGLGDEKHAVGRACVVPEHVGVAMVKADCFRVRLDHRRLSASFAAYFLSSEVARAGFAMLSRGATRERINLGGAAAIGVPIPPLDEQRAIVTFLDCKTAKIDALIAKETAIASLFGQRRDSLLSSLLDKAPAGRVRLKFVADILPGYAFPSEWFRTSDQGLRLLRGINVAPGKVDWSEVVCLSPEADCAYGHFSLRRDDVVVGMDRPWISGGLRVARLGDADIPSLVVQRVARIRCSSQLDPTFLELCLRAPQFWAHVEPDMTGVSVPHISDRQIGDFKVPLMSLEEQKHVAAHVVAEVKQLDDISGAAADMTERLRERRAALVTAAVTGQIEVTAPMLAEAAA